MYSSVEQTLFKFANSFDSKEWDSLEETLADTIECDYSGLRGTIETLANKEYVSLRKQALQDLDTQHLFSNLEINVSRDTATCRLSAIIFRRKDDKICMI